MNAERVRVYDKREDMCMEFQIKIVEGHDPSSYFWFRPVILKESGVILWDEVTVLGEEFSIEEGDVDCFLSYFFYKHFDENLTYNKRREEEIEDRIHGFEWYLTDNFFTYDGLREMVKDIEETAALLETDYDNPRLDDVKEKFSIFYMCSRDDEDWMNPNDTSVRRHISVVIDFYHRFTKRITAMMDNNKGTNVISIMGP